MTGLGIAAAIGTGVDEFAAALRDGVAGIASVAIDGLGTVPGAPLPSLDWTARAGGAEARTVLRAAPRSSAVAAAVAAEAAHAARLDDVEPEARALLIAGNNLHPAYGQEHHRRFLERPAYVNPRYALTFPDTYALAVVSELRACRGPGFVAGGGFASGNVALGQALALLRAGDADVCLVVAPPSDYGALERRAFANLGAAAAEVDDPASACRPFDRSATGFVPGEGGAALVLESLAHARARSVPVLAELLCVAVVLQGRNDAAADSATEVRAMRLALRKGGLAASDVDYVSAHATSTPQGDAAEASAIDAVFGPDAHPVVNATKALTGHALTAAAAVEAVAVILQLREGYVHANPQLRDPVDPPLRHARATALRPERLRTALSNAFSMGGIATSAAFAAYEATA